MSAFGYTVNVITLLALSLSVGLLIDDAIVVRENIFRHMKKLHQDPYKAASDGTSEVGLAVTATTLTLVAVFLPVAFTPGMAGKFFRQFGITVAAAVLISLFEAFTFAPMLSAHFFRAPICRAEKRSPRGSRTSSRAFYDFLGNSYRPILRWSLKHRLTIVVLTTLIFGLSGYLFRVVGVGGTPHGERAEFNLVIQTGIGKLPRPDRSGRPAPGGRSEGPEGDRRRDHGRRLDGRILGRGHGQRQAPHAVRETRRPTKTGSGRSSPACRG